MERTGDPKGTEGNDPTRVLLADDHAEFREGLKEMLLADEGIEVVGEAGDGAQTIEVAERVRPDVVVLDLAMPLVDGREVPCPILHDVWRPPRVVILTMHDGTGQRRELLGMGPAPS